MSVYKPKNTPFYHFDFQVAGRRFHGSTGETARRKAEEVEKAEKDAAKAAVKSASRAKGTILTLDDAAERYYLEVGAQHANADTTATDLERIVGYLGSATLMSSIRDEHVNDLVGWRRSQPRWGRERTKDDEPMRTVSAATVNRSTTLVLKKLFTRAKRNWGYVFPDEPDWKRHWLQEPREIVRELKGSQRTAIDLATRDDYGPILAFVQIAGCRLNECLIRWEDVDWETGLIERVGKGGKMVRTRITPSIKSIIEPLLNDHEEWVFTYRALRTRKAPKVGIRERGKRYPITYEGLKSQWKRIRERAGVEGFRFHDFRHDVATKLLRQTGNLKTVQRALNHSDIKTTTRYAHVLDEEVAADMEKLAKQIRDKKSRNKSRSK